MGQGTRTVEMAPSVNYNHAVSTARILGPFILASLCLKCVNAMTRYEAPFRIVIFKHEPPRGDSGCGAVGASLRAEGWKGTVDVGNGTYTFRRLAEHQLEGVREAAEQCGAEYRVFDAKDREVRRQVLRPA